MMLSVMVVGAGAAFSDQSKIKNTEAVDACTALNIIGGYPDGSFKPEGNITRAEVTKMICVALNGGKNPAVSTNTTPTFSDVRNNANAAWAEGYIESCAAQGIVSGVGGGKFNPAGNVTGVQLAKMLLVSLGYKSENEGFTGNAWATNVNVRAAQKGLYDGLEKMDTSAALTRDNAAQMVWNALKAYEVEYVTNLIADKDGKLSTQITVQDKIGNDNLRTKLTLLRDKYNADTREDTILISVKKNSKGTYTVKTKKDSADVVTYTEVTKDYTDLLGQKVDVLVKTDDNSKVYGIYPTDDNTVAIKTTIGQLSELKTADKTFEVNGDKTKYDASITVYDAKGTSSANTVANLMRDDGTYNTASTVYLVSNDGDNNVDRAVVIPAQVAKVTYVGSSSLTLGNSIGSIDLDDIQTYDGIKKDDFVLYTKDADNTADSDVAVKVDTVDSTVSATKGTANEKGYEIKVDGNWYRVGVTAKNTVASKESVRSGDKVKLAVYDGCFYDVDKNAVASNEDILFVKEAGKIQSGINSGVEASVLFTDGTEKTITVSKIVNPTNDDIEKDAKKAALLYTTKVDNDETVIVDNNTTAYRTGTDGKVYVGALYTYEIDGSKYKLTPITNDNMANYDAQGDGTWDGDDDQFADKRVDDNAVIFVAKNMPSSATGSITGADAKIVTGKTLKSWKDYGVYGQFIAMKSNGINSVMVGALINTADSYGSKSGNYGIVVDDPENVRINSTNYVSLSVWNGTENVTMLVKGSNLSAYTKGQVFSYDTDGTEKDGDKEVQVIKSYTAVSKSAAMLGASADGKKFDVELTDTGVAGTGNSTTYKVTEDTTVLFLDGKKGVAGGDLTSYAAMESSIKDQFIKNVYYEVDKGKDLDLLVVAVDGKLALNGDIAENGAKIDTSAKTLVLKKGTDVRTTDKTIAAIKEQVKNVLTVSCLSESNNTYLVVAADGSEYTFTVSVAPLTATFSHETVTTGTDVTAKADFTISKETNLVNGEEITVTVTKKTGEVPNDFGPGTYTLGVTGATAESVTTTANQKELKFTLTVGTQDIVVTSLSKTVA